VTLLEYKPKHRYGRLPSAPRDLTRMVPLRRILDAAYSGPVPDTAGYLPDVANLPMDSNDALGDCTAAAAAHAETVFSQFGQGTPVVPANSDVIAFYSGSTGYVPGNPATDQGGDMATVLKYWQHTGIAGHKLAAYFAIDPRDFEGLRAAVYLFGAAYIGFNATQGFENAFSSQTVFDVLRRDRVLGGHCVTVDQVVKGGNIEGATWGGLYQMTEAAWTKYVDEPYAVISQEWVKSGVTPPGLDVNAANAAFTQITGQPGPFTGAPPTPVPVPTPPPVPTPTPTPPGDADTTFAAAAHAWLTAKGL
jgi:hypothetical protein